MNFAKAFKLLDLNFKDSVSILAFNHPLWNQIFWGSILSNCIPVGHYQTNTPETCKDIINDSRTRLMFVDTPEQLDKILSIKDSTPSLEYIVTFEKFPNVAYLSKEELAEIANK
jgi:long-subunit acyl-CoA synthetase (AMP-forming)